VRLPRCDVRGLHQLLQKRSLTLVSFLRRLAATEIGSALHLRDFRRPAIFEFFNTIRHKRPLATRGGITPQTTLSAGRLFRDHA
jgi:hypothetical protein